MMFFAAGGLLPVGADSVVQAAPLKTAEKTEKAGKAGRSAASVPEATPDTTPQTGLQEQADDPEESESREAEVAVARPVSGDPVQVYGWREWVYIGTEKDSQKLLAKLDTGARTSSVHVEDKELFERDGKKWVKFVVTDPTDEKGKRMRVEAPLVRIARIKNPGGESEERETVLLNFKIGDRWIKAQFTLNNRSNMVSPVLIGRRTLQELGVVDPGHVFLADKKVIR